MKIIKRLVFIGITLAAIAVFCHWQNNDIVTTRIDFQNSGVPGRFEGCKIVQVSDLHNEVFGRDNARLLKKIREAQPHILVITGDLIDSRKTDQEAALAFIREAVEIAPVYFVSGNHEKNSGIYPHLQAQLSQAGVKILDDTGIILQRGEDSIALLGLADPTFIGHGYNQEHTFSQTLTSIADDFRGEFTVLLSHRPEKMRLYVEQGIDLVFAGHAHGGQFRLPLVGGLAAPDQGFFPKYTSGLYTEGSTSMVVSRGLGNSIFPLRLFNRPELVVVTLRNQ